MICFKCSHNREVMLCDEFIVSAVPVGDLDSGKVTVTMQTGETFQVLITWDEFKKITKADDAF